MLLRSMPGFCKLIKYLTLRFVKLEVTQSLSSVSATKPGSISVLLILYNKSSAQVLSKVPRCWLGQFGKARVKLRNTCSLARGPDAQLTALRCPQQIVRSPPPNRPPGVHARDILLYYILIQSSHALLKSWAKAVFRRLDTATNLSRPLVDDVALGLL